jgi:hypothetical protein
MNELKQIRSMAEMILEKVDALEGAKPFPQNGFREFVPEVNVWMPKFAIGDTVYYKPDGGDEEYECTISGIHPTYNSYMVVSHGGLYEYWVAEKFLRGEPAVKEPKFKVGDRVCTTVGEAGKITGIHKLDGHYRYLYLVLFDNGDHHHVVEPLLELSKPDPKFKIGDRIVGDMSSPMIGTIIKLGTTEQGPEWFTVLWSNGLCNSVHTSRMRLATEDDREWHSGPPPHIGWWNASNTKILGAWRWWNGSSWSQYAHSADDAKWAHGQAMWVTTDTNIQWTDYWPENARVPRIDPRNVK